jgi:hypothetical protein
MNENNEEKGYKISDRRSVSMSEEEKREREETIKKGQKKTEETIKEKLKEAPSPQMDFSNLILSLSTSALLNLGEVPDPVTKEKKKDIDIAKQTIDLISILKEKTKGNLTKEEESLVDSALYDLRMRYVKEINKK